MKKYNWVAQDSDGEIECDVIQRHGARNPNWRESLIDLSKNDYIIKDGILMATRKHAALIHAWADGAIFRTNKWLI